MFKKLLIPAVAFALNASQSAALAQSYPWGTVLVSSGSWMAGQGLDVYWNGTPNCNPSYVGGTSYTTYNGVNYYTGSQYQCGELVYRTYTTMGWWPGTWGGANAWQLYTLPASNMTTYSNGSGYIPVPGDCICWNGPDTAGHVSVVNYVDGGHVYVGEQNMCNYGVAILNRSGTGGSYFARADGWDTKNGVLGGYLLGCVHCSANPNTYVNPHINPCVARTSDGRMELFAVGNTGNLYHDYQTTANGSWSGWVAMGTSANVWSQSTLPAVGVNPDGRLEVFIVGTNGVINHIWQLKAGSSATTNWSSFGTFNSYVSQTAKLAVGNLQNGQLDVFVIGTDGVLYHNYVGSSGWTGFTSLGGSWPQDADLAVASEKDGRQAVFVIGNSGSLYNNWQTSPTSTNWNGWNDLTGWLAEAARLAVGRNSDGRLEVFTLGTDGIAYHTWENSANASTNWSGWASLGSNKWEVDAKPIVASDSNGSLEVLMVGANGNVYHNYQSPGWSGWLSLGGSFPQNARPCISANADGRLEMFLNGSGTAMQTSWETSVNGTNWYSWFSLGGSWK